MTKLVVLLLLLVTLATLAMNSDCNACARSGDCSIAHASGPGQHCGGYDKLGHRTECCCGEHQECVDPTLVQQCRCTKVVLVQPAATLLDVVALFVLFGTGNVILCLCLVHCINGDCSLRCKTVIASISRRIVAWCSGYRRLALPPTKRSMRSSHTLLVDDE